MGTIPSIKNLHWLWLWQGTSSPSDYHLFTALNQNIGCHRFTDDGDVEKGVTRWLITQHTDWHQEAKRKAPPTIGCLGCGRDYAGGSCAGKHEAFVLEVKIKKAKYRPTCSNPIFWPVTFYCRCTQLDATDTTHPLTCEWKVLQLPFCIFWKSTMDKQ